MKKKSGRPGPCGLPALYIALVLVAASLAVATPAAIAADTSVAPTSPSRTEDRLLNSAALGRPMSFLVYLPPGYDANSAQRYPALYMLHGLGGTYTDWRSFGLLREADRLIIAGAIKPLVIVMPQGDSGYWIDQANGGPKYGTYVARDLVHEVDDTYRTLADANDRAIGGLSMGAHGALQLALNFPGTFDVVGAHSLVLRRYDQAFSFFGDKTYFAQHDPVSIVAAKPELVRPIHLWIDIGKDDTWSPQAEAFNRELRGAGIRHDWLEFSGGHDPAYWSAHVDDYLRFYGEALSHISPDPAG